MSLEPALEIYLVRHGEVDVPPAMLYGQMDVPLSEAGRQQSLAAARRLVELQVDALLSSDLSRAAYMARLVEQLGGPEPRFFKELREVDFGSWAGLTRREIDERWPGAMEERYRDLVNYRPPGGENLKDLLGRGWKIIEQAVSGRYGRRVAVTAHGGLIRAITCRAIGLELDKLFNLELDYGCMNRLDAWDDGIFVLKYSNLSP